MKTCVCYRGRSKRGEKQKNGRSLNAICQSINYSYGTVSGALPQSHSHTFYIRAHTYNSGIKTWDCFLSKCTESVTVREWRRWHWFSQHITITHRHNHTTHKARAQLKGQVYWNEPCIRLGAQIELCYKSWTYHLLIDLSSYY